MLNINYSSLEKYYIYPQHINKYGFKTHLHDIDHIVKTNPDQFSLSLTKKYLYFIMPICGHPEKISLYELKKRIKNNQDEKLCCRICRLLIDSKTNYSALATLYSVNNSKPLSQIKSRKNSITFICPICYQETTYSEFRWVLNGLREGKSFKEFCKRKCFSIGEKHPKIVDLWDEEKNKVSIFKIPANDENLYHRKWYFKCSVCQKTTESPTTVNNIVKNSSKCLKHKISKSSSFPEQSIFLSFTRCLSKFSYIEVTNKYKYYRNHEFDIFIQLRINNNIYLFAIEYDGPQHINRILNDIDKNTYAANNNIYIVRVRDAKLANITLENFNNIIQRNSNDKGELNEVIPKLLDKFIEWLSSLSIEVKAFNKVKKLIEQEMKNVDVLKDENIIFEQSSDSFKKLLKDDPKLNIIFNQLRQDIRAELADVITTTEQDIKRTFVCRDCGNQWDQYVFVVVKNFLNSKNGATGCPFCANKSEWQLSELKRKALLLKDEGFTQKAIGAMLGRSQSTISSWLSNNEKIS
ncbi:helix-turn-helix domain-containing protein [Bacillus sp. ISL-41]|uniref:helix-turn-helix domain-containing protein n=1 Tax=Bacillus sp. ISL-41 TaxID=2819127 RepID=UPI001BE50A22|nr:helix-turn-helix domain-containing protein [Bacillus sp. ISL-41]MBT2641720.1 helix-turn-helix domain-containing protein [Bacillus sp. ISL-41]